MKLLRTGDNNMSSLFEDLQEGLQEAIEYEQGSLEAETTTIVKETIQKQVYFYNRIKDELQHKY